MKRKKAVKTGKTAESARSGNRQEQRTRVILTWLQESGSVEVEELAEQVTAPVVTICRDLNHLEPQGLLKRAHGASGGELGVPFCIAGRIGPGSYALGDGVLGYVSRAGYAGADQGVVPQPCAGSRGFMVRSSAVARLSSAPVCLPVPHAGSGTSASALLCRVARSGRIFFCAVLCRRRRGGFSNRLKPMKPEGFAAP